MSQTPDGTPVPPESAPGGGAVPPARAFPVPPDWPVPPGWTVLTVPGDPRTYVLPPAGADEAARSDAARSDAAKGGPRPSAPAPTPPAYDVAPPGSVRPRPSLPVPGEAPQGGRLPVLGKLFGASAAAVVVLGVAAGATMLVTGLIVFQLWGFAHFDATLALALTTFLVTGGHAATSLWAARRRPVRWWAVGVTQAPFAAAYALGIAWYFSRDAGLSRTGFPPLYILWGAAALSALAWLIVWYAANPRPARRAVVFLSACAVLVAGNGAGVFALVWNSTNGLGLVGAATPWEALDDLLVTSCLGNGSFYTFDGKLRKAACPSGPTADLYAGDYDKSAFDQLLCGEQPREAFAAWWQRSQRYKVAITLDFPAAGQWRTTVDDRVILPPLPAKIDGGRATISLAPVLQTAFHIGASDPATEYPMRVDKDTETWNVGLQHQPLGGWKVCRIDVPAPIQDHPTSADPIPSPSSTSDDPLGGLASSLPCGPLDPFRQYHNCPSDSPSPGGTPGSPSPAPGPSTS